MLDPCSDTDCWTQTEMLNLGEMLGIYHSRMQRRWEFYGHTRMYGHRSGRNKS